MVRISVVGHYCCMLFYAPALLLLGTEGSTSSASNITTTAITTSNYEDRARTIAQAKFGEIPRELPREWIRLNDTRWEHYNLTTCWNSVYRKRKFINPGLFFSSTFGYVKAERITFQEYAYPHGNFWRDVNKFEQTCLCNRKLGYIKPDLTIEALDREYVYTRPTGNQVRLVWRWNTTDSKMLEHSPGGTYQRAVTKYKLMALRLFAKYSSIRISCRKFVTHDPMLGYLMSRYNASDTKITDCAFKNSRLYCVNCTTQGLVVAYEPHSSDILVQEEDPTLRLSFSLGSLEFIPGKYNFHPSIPVWTDRSGDDKPWLPEKIKWILPTFPNKGGLNFRDGEHPVRTSDLVPMFKYYPSLLASDQNCIRRTRLNVQSCTDPVGGLELKLAHWKDIHYDSESNSPRYPGPPLVVIGNAGSHPKESRSTMPGKRRRKRFFFSMLILFFSVITTVAVTSNLQSVINENVDNLTDQMNTRYTKIESDLKSIADELNELSLIGVARANKLNEVIKNNLRRDQTNEERFRTLSNMVLANRNMILAQVDNYLSTIQTIQKMSLAEISINQLVLKELQSLTAKPIFDQSKAYTVRLKDGLISLREEAQELAAFREDYINNTNRQGEKLRLARRELQDIRDQTTISFENWQEDVNNSVYINTTGFRNENISFVHLQGIIGEKFFDEFGTAVRTVANGTGTVLRNLAEGAGDIISQGIDGVTGILGSGLGTILKDLLAPIIIVVTIIVALILIVKLYPICFPKRKKARNTIIQRNNRSDMEVYAAALMTQPRTMRRIVKNPRRVDNRG